MTNKIAIALGILIIAAIIWDVSLRGGENLLFLGRKMSELIEWLAFWR